MSLMSWFSQLKGCKKYEVIEESDKESYHLKVSKDGVKLFESIIDRCHCSGDHQSVKKLVFELRESLKNQGYEL